MDPEEFRIYGKKMVDFAADYISNIRKYDVLPSVSPGYLRNILPDVAPDKPVPFAEVMADVDKAIIPGMAHWHNPNFFAFYPTAFSFPSMLGSMLSDTFACIGLNWEASPACTELELLMLDWLVKAMGLPDHFLSTSESGGGCILSSASESTLMALLVARNSKIKSIQEECPEIKDGESVDKMVVYFTKQAHSSVERACSISLLKYKYIETMDDERLDISDLQRIVESDRKEGLLPLMVVASFGSTSMCSFDNLKEVGSMCKSLQIKLHVDAAYAGSALICPEFRHLAEGIELSNSFCFNAHKMLKTHFDCSILWTDDRHSAVEAFSVNPVYLSHGFESVTAELRHWQISLGRRFRSLKLWFVLNMFGLEGLQESIRKHVQLAKRFEEKVRSNASFEVVNSVQFGLVCFRLKGENEKSQRLVNKLKEDKTVFLSPSVLEKKDLYFLRFVCGGEAMEDDIDAAFTKIEKVSLEVLDSNA